MLATLLLSLSMTANISVIAPPEPQQLEVEPNHSTVQFSIDIAGGLTRVTGKFNAYQIYIDLVDEDLTKSSITATIDAASVNTGISDRDDHLRTADFFGIDEHPEIVFETTSIVKDGEGYLAKGTLQLLGVSRDHEIPFVMTGRDGKNTFGFSGRTSIRRSDFDFASDFQHTAIENFLSDEVIIEIDFWTRKRKTDK